jgi:hypothetical protein
MWLGGGKEHGMHVTTSPLLPCLRHPMQRGYSPSMTELYQCLKSKCLIHSVPAGTGLEFTYS